MIPTKDQLKDLRTFTAQEFQPGIHWLKMPDGKFEIVEIRPEEIKDPKNARTVQLRELIRTYCAQGRLFTRINAPFRRFSE